MYYNLKIGEIDFCGINYYSPKQAEDVVNAIEEKKPEEHQVVLDWLNKTKEINGVYIFGV